MTMPDYLAHLEDDSQQFAELLRAHPGAAVPTCPGWELHDLAAHLGRVYAMVAGIVTARATSFVRPGPEAEAPDADQLDAWFADRRAQVLEALRGIGSDEPVWSWSTRHDGGFYHRRMAMETAVHRWDAADATGTHHSIPRDLAVDGIDEVLEVGMQHSMSRPERTYPAGSLHLHCTDGDGEWLVRADGDAMVITHEHAKGDAAVRGPAAALLLYLWGRVTPEVEVIGDAATAEAWAALTP